MYDVWWQLQPSSERDYSSSETDSSGIRFKTASPVLVSSTLNYYNQIIITSEPEWKFLRRWWIRCCGLVKNERGEKKNPNNLWIFLQLIIGEVFPGIFLYPKLADCPNLPKPRCQTRALHFPSLYKHSPLKPSGSWRFEPSHVIMQLWELWAWWMKRTGNSTTQM